MRKMLMTSAILGSALFLAPMAGASASTESQVPASASVVTHVDAPSHHSSSYGEKDFRRGYRTGFKDGYEDAKDDCQLSRDSRNNYRSRQGDYERGYDKGYQAGYERSSDRFC